MTAALLRTKYDTSIPLTVWVAGESGAPSWVPTTPAADPSTFCVVAQEGTDQYAYKLGPAGQITSVSESDPTAVAAKLCQ